ncbi:MAG: formimidoylglutamase [Planctomycetia bacterium]|nr:formimidoylglutamase [Planctomycetia bacterium]
MPANPEMSVWAGRDDTAAEGQQARRWHQVITSWTAKNSPGHVLLGFACDEGVKRNQGRAGAAEAPQALRRALANLAWHNDEPLYDGGDVVCDGPKMEEGQQQLAERIEYLLAFVQKVTVLGGGHETAWGTFQGLKDYTKGKKFGIINCDAHFDLRQNATAHSGTPFSQIAQWCEAEKLPFNYFCLGIAEPSNTTALFDRARSLGATWLTDIQLNTLPLDTHLEQLRIFLEPLDLVYLSIDLDVLPVDLMPGVSAPASLGMPLIVLLELIQTVAESGKLAIADMVELSPPLDPSQQSARVAARIVWHLLHHWTRPLPGHFHAKP